MTPVNDAPITSADSFTITEDTAQTSTATILNIDVTSNDSDPEGSDITLVSVGSASNGTVTLLTTSTSGNDSGSNQFQINETNNGDGTSIFANYIVKTFTGTIYVDVTDGNQAGDGVYTVTGLSLIHISEPTRPY